MKRVLSKYNPLDWIYVLSFLFHFFTVQGSHVCEDGWVLYDKKCYYNSTNAVTWGEANMDCLAKNGQLAEIVDESTKENFYNRSNGSFWIGLTYKKEANKFIWNSGSSLTFSDWLSGSPSGSGSDSCVTLFSNQSVSGWIENNCLFTNQYICERKPLELSFPSIPITCLWLGQENKSAPISPLIKGIFNNSWPLFSAASERGNDTCPSKNLYICENETKGTFILERTGTQACDAPDVCDLNASCTKVNNVDKCTCNNGYKGDGSSCIDIDECTDGTSNCPFNARCENFPGSFACTCKWGFKSNGHSCISQLEYQCNPDDSINVFNLPNDSYIFAMQVVTNGSDIQCSVHDDNETTVTLTGCSKGEEIIITYGSFNGLATYKVLGGKHLVTLKFVCLEIPEEGVNHLVNSSYSTKLIVGERISLDPSYSVTSSLSSTSTTVGSEIVWQIQFPEHYSLEISSCTAYPGSEDSSADHVSLISNGGCAVIMELISNFNSYNNGTATATLRAFKFYNSESVLLKCSLKVCPSETTSTACMTTCSRVKRNVIQRATRRPRSVFPVTVSSLLHVAEVHSNGTSKCMIGVPMTVLLPLMIILTRAAGRNLHQQR